jgi:tRNA dimethylallyltransferase
VLRKRLSIDTHGLLTPKRKTLVVCGPTAAGKSSLADALAELLSDAYGAWVTTIVVDSMQIYEEIPTITNQARARPAEMVSIVSVAEEWTVARHKEKAEAIISSLAPNLPFVLDAGTGMYLNALILDIPLAPKVPEELRAKAEKVAAGAENPRREARELELRLARAPERGSIWDGDLRYETTLLYLRPPREALDRNVEVRTSKIARSGAEEAEKLLRAGVKPNPSVRGAIGVKEMLLCASGKLSEKEAEETIAARTRRLARRQIRWFDKLTRSLPDAARVLVVGDIEDSKIKHLMHDTIDA